MKNIKYIAVAMALTMTSCEDWLEVKSETKFDSETVFETVSKAEMTILGAYSSTFNRELFYQLGMGTEACYSTEGNTNSKNQVANYLYTTANAPSSTYAAMYAGIEYTNVAIKGLSAMTGSSEEEQKKINMLLGEAYAIRAMNYFNVVRFFGDVPYVTVPVIDQESFSSSRVSRDIIYDGCVADLQEAVKLLPWQSEGMVAGPERFTKNSAYGILARVALYAAGYSLRWDLETYSQASVKLAQRSDANRITELYTIARDACKAVIDKGENGLVDSYEKVFRQLVNGEYNKESMLEFGQEGTVNSSNIGYTNGMFSHTNSMYQKAQPAMGVIANYYYEFEESDTRRDVAICTYSIAADNTRQMNEYTSNAIGKFRVSWKKEIGTKINARDINWSWLRYSDVLLMYAEAENELNNAPTAAAKSAYEAVRKRAFDDDTLIGTTPDSYQGFKDAIIQERLLELAFEGMRRTDLVRWGILYEKLTKSKQDLIDMANHTGKYATIDKFRAYKKEKATSFEDPVVAVPFIGYKEEPSAEEKERLEKEGYTLVNMYAAGNLMGKTELKEDANWVKELFRGLEKNKVECLPLATSAIIDVNPGLAGQQHPCY